MVPPNLKEHINRQERRRRQLAAESNDKEQEQKAEVIEAVAETTIDASEWQGEIDDSVQLV